MPFPSHCHLNATCGYASLRHPHVWVDCFVTEDTSIKDSFCHVRCQTCLPLSLQLAALRSQRKRVLFFFTIHNIRQRQSQRGKGVHPYFLHVTHLSMQLHVPGTTTRPQNALKTFYPPNHTALFHKPTISISISLRVFMIHDSCHKFVSCNHIRFKFNDKHSSFVFGKQGLHGTGGKPSTRQNTTNDASNVRRTI